MRRFYGQLAAEVIRAQKTWPGGLLPRGSQWEAHRFHQGNPELFRACVVGCQPQHGRGRAARITAEALWPRRFVAIRLSRQARLFAAAWSFRRRNRDLKRLRFCRPGEPSGSARASTCSRIPDAGWECVQRAEAGRAEPSPSGKREAVARCEPGGKFETAGRALQRRGIVVADGPLLGYFGRVGECWHGRPIVWS